jgi:hypothetical protein
VNKYLKLANYFDSKGLYKSADSLELFVKKAQGLSFVEKQPDLAKIEKSNKIANDIVYYAASVSQGTRTPSYDPKSFFTTIQKIESMKNNPDVQTNFPNIYSSLDAAIELLKSKSLGQKPGEQTPGDTPESAPINPQNPNSPSDATKEDIEFVRKTISNMKRYIGDIKRWRSKQKLKPVERGFLQSDEKVQENITAYSNLLESSIKILRSEKYKKAVNYLKSIGEFDPETDIPSSPESITPDAPIETDFEFIRKTYEDMKRFAEYDIPRHQRDLELLDPETEQEEIRNKRKIINNYLALIDKAKLILNNPKYKKAVDELIKRGELPSEEVSEGPVLPKSGNSRTEAGKILDEAYPTYSSRDPKPDQRLPGLDGTGLEREQNKAKINFDYMQKFPPLNAGQNEIDPAGGPKIKPEQLSKPRESSEDYYQVFGMPFKAVQMPKGFENMGKPFFGLGDQK